MIICSRRMIRTRRRCRDVKENFTGAGVDKKRAPSYSEKLGVPPSSYYFSGK